jgi:hypothetical protein
VCSVLADIAVSSATTDVCDCIKNSIKQQKLQEKQGDII